MTGWSLLLNKVLSYQLSQSFPHFLFAAICIMHELANTCLYVCNFGNPFIRSATYQPLPEVFLGMAGAFKYFPSCGMKETFIYFLVLSQTWDLMRLCWYGFKGYCQEFFEQHPLHYVVPLRANGSAIETIFGQLKHGSRGTLTATTYGPARSQLLTKRSIHGPHIRDEYRDAPL